MSPIREAARKFLLVSGDFVTTGGMDRANHALATYLANCGHAVDIVAFRIDDALGSHPNVHFHRVPKPANSYTLALPLLDHHGRRWARLLAADGARVIVNGGSCRWGDVNWVHYVHAAYQPEVAHGIIRRLATWRNHRRWLRDERAALLNARVIIANSQATRRDLIATIGVNPQFVHVIYLGVDPQKFFPVDCSRKKDLRCGLGFSNDDRLIVFIGALSDRRKGFDVLFDAWVALSREPAWGGQLLVIGGGSEIPAWKRAASAAGVESSIQFLGRRDDVQAILQASDLVVAPSRYEPYGLAVHEGLCCGVPAIVSASAGVAERYDDAMRPLLLENPGDPGELIAKLQRWSGQSDHYAQAARNLGDRLRQHTWDRMSGEILEKIGY